MNANNNHKEMFKMTVTAQKWGNSIGIRISQKTAKKYRVVNGTEIEVFDNGDGILLKLVNDRYTLDKLLPQVTSENKHDYVEFARKGNELI